MEVITENPIIYIGKDDTYDAEIFLALDGKSKKSDVQEFQDWMDTNYPTWLNGKKLNKGEGYGFFRKNTKKAYETYGEQWERSRMVVGIKKKENVPPPLPNVIPAVNPSPKTIEEAKKKGFNWDKARGVFVKAQELGIIDALLNKIGITPKTPDMPQVGTEGEFIPTGETSKPMSTTTKVLIGVGALAIIGSIIYFSKKSK